jgi:phage shock protein A
MGLFSRLGDIINSNLNAMLDGAENPEKIARLIIQEMEDTLVEVRTSAARAMADKKEMEREIVQFSASRDDWAAKAELAIDKGREDLARGALLAKQKSETEIVRRQEDLVKLQAKLDEAKAKHRALVMRREAAEQRIRMRSQLYDGRADEAILRYNQLERKVDEMEAYADTIRGGEPGLAQEFAELEQNESVEKELAALKARKGKPASKKTEG